MTWALRVVLVSTSPSVDHERAQPLAVVVVVDADRGDVLDVLVAREAVLDLLGEDVLAAGDDHLVVAALDEQAAVLVEAADVAAATSGRRSSPCSRPVAGVAVEEHRVADEDPAGLPLLDRLAVVVVDPDDVLHGGLPAVPGASRMSAGCAIVAQATSVEP